MVEQGTSENILPKVHSRFTDIMAEVNDAHQLGLLPRTLKMCRDGDALILKSHDVSHDWQHYRHLGLDTAIILEQYPFLHDAIDWNSYAAAISFHDQWRSSLTPTPWNAIIGEKMEPTFASGYAKKYMKSHGFSTNEIKNISYLIQVPPYALDDRRRRALEQNIDPKLRLTSRLMYVVDSLDVFRLDRIDKMIEHLSRSFGGISSVPFYKQLAKYYEQNTNFSFDLGVEYPWIPEEAARRRQQAFDYIAELVSSRRDVRH